MEISLTVKTYNDLRSFSFSDKTWDADWKKLSKECSKLTKWGLDKLKPGLKGSIKTIVLESEYICKDHRNLFSNYYSKKFQEVSPVSSRLHLFNCDVRRVEELLQNPQNYRDSYIGYIVIRPLHERSLGRTIIDPKKLVTMDQKNSYFLTATFHVHIGGVEFKVAGYPYMSQDGDVTVCAHSVLWGMCRYLSEKYSIYREFLPFDLIKLTETTSGRTFPYRGMTYSDYSKILSDFGSYPLIIRVKKSKNDSIDTGEFKNLCTYVESGFPVLSSFQGHVVTIIGHTIDYSKFCDPDEFGFIDSSSFLKQFIVIDDNFFPYQLLGDEKDPHNYGLEYDSEQYYISSIVAAVCPLPEKVFLPAEKARDAAMKYFIGMKGRLSEKSNGPWVTRLFLTTNSAFKRRKIEKSTNASASIDKLSAIVPYLNMPHFVWVMEVSPADKYNDGQCIAEIVLDSTSNDWKSGVLYLRIGNTMFIDGQEKTFDKEPMFFPQFTHNLGER
jgi:hypothetical protein